MNQTKSTSKKLLALLLALIMTVSLLPMSVFAAELAADEPTQEAAMPGDEQDAENAALTEEGEEDGVSVYAATDEIAVQAATEINYVTKDGEGKSLKGDTNFYRIFLLDCGRKYFSVDEINGIIDQLAANQYTHIELAFGNDGLRFLLNDMSVTVGGKTYTSDQVKSAIQKGNDSFDNGTYYYPEDKEELTQDDMDNIIGHAKKNGIGVIPLFNAPGHMYTVVNAMKNLGMSVKSDTDYIEANFYAGKAANWAVIPTSAAAVNFVQALMQKYVKYFADMDCTMFNIGADESGIDTNTYSAYAKLINSHAAMVQNAGMVALAFNDGINRTDMTVGTYDPFDTNIAVCYWAEDTGNAYNSVKNLYDAGFTIINNNDAWYYVLGDFLKESWGSDQWGYNFALNGIRDTPVTQAKNLADKAIGLAGSVLCCWCDGPKKSFSESKEKVYNLIEAMAKANPKYFNAEEKPVAPELVVDTAAGGVTATKQSDGSYSVAVKANDTVKLTVNNYSGSSLTWDSSDKAVATVDSTGKVTFTGNDGEVTITATPPEATKGETAAAYSITFKVTARTGGDLENVPAYAEGKVTGSSATEVEYVLDTDGVDANEKYLIVAANSAVALRRNGNRNIATQSVEISDDKATIESNESTSLWTFSSATSGTIENGNYYLRHSNSLGVGTNNNNNNNSWTIKSNSNGTYRIYYTSGKTTYYLAANGTGSSFTLTTSASNVRLYKQQTKAAGFTVDTTNLAKLIDYAEKLTAGEFSNWAAVGMDDALTAAKDALNAVSNPYATETAADNAQNSVNTAAENLYNALAQLTRGERVSITVYCVDESGTRIGEKNGYTFYAYENAEGTYTYTFNAPTITGYRCNRGSLITGNVAGENETVTLVYRKGSFTLPDSIEIPITIVDYRADGLLFEYDIYSNSIAYQLVHTAVGDTRTSAEAAIDGTKYETLTPQDNQSKSNQEWHQWNGSWIRTGMVKDSLGENGMPVYTDATVQYVAEKLSSGIIADRSSSAKNWNDILYKTFLKTGAARSVLDSTTTGFSPAFANTKSYDNITNAYDLAWYLLNTLYIGDNNMAEVTDNVTKETYTLPIYGMADDTYNKLILVKETDGTYYMKAYTDGAKLKYDEANGAIYNSADSSNTNISKFMYPLCGKGYDKYLGDTTDNQAGTKADELYPVNPNGNYTLRGESQFVYYADQNQYFEFTGDDDVYLFINGKLVLDLGGAHWSLKKTVYMDDIAEKCGLQDGQIATFTFFYMERFSDCSNFGIRTNMGLVERGINVEKKGYDASYNNEIASGSVIENGTAVAYDLTVTNNGDSDMSQIKFVDADKNGATVSIGYDVEEPALTSADGQFTLSQLSGYALFITDHNGKQVANSRKDFSTLKELSDEVGKITLTSGQTLHVRFLQVTADVPPSTMADYSNTVTVTAVSGGQSLTDDSTHVLYAYNAADTAKDYVVDFGLPLKITNIFDESSKNYIVNEVVKESKSCKLNYGTLKISGSGFNTELIYTLKEHTAIDAVENIVLDVNYKFGEGANAFTTTLQKTIRIIPASTVYYEDDFMSFTNKDNSTSVTSATTVDTGFWHTVTDGNKPTETVYQALDKLGDASANNYGYDLAYDTYTKFSLGSAVKVTVDKDSKGDAGWPYATFTFKGTGFDIISLTDNTSGAIYVDIYKGDKVDETQRLKGYVVNNYYGYTYDKTTGEWTIAANTPNATYQVPVIKSSGLDYAQYTVKITVGYSQYQDVANNGKYSFWMDAIRVYDPAGTTAINQDYAKDSEQNPDFVQLRKVLLDAYEGELTNGAVFIDGMGATSTVADYKNYGPNHEVYLASGQAIAFQLVANAEPEGLQLGAKLANGSNATLTVDGTTFVKGTSKTLNLATATDMFYELNVDNWTREGDLWKSNVITLTNNSADMISLTNLKLINATYADSVEAVTNAASGEVLVTMMMDADAAQKAIAAVDSVLHPQEEVKTFTPERFEASWNRSSVKAGEKATLTVKTSEDVEAITVDGVTIDTYRTRTQRTGWGWNAKKVTYREFTYTITASETADHEIVAVNVEGTASEAITATLTVRAAAQRPGWGGWFGNLFSRWF